MEKRSELKKVLKEIEETLSNEDITKEELETILDKVEDKSKERYISVKGRKVLNKLLEITKDVNLSDLVFIVNKIKTLLKNEGTERNNRTSYIG